MRYILAGVLILASSLSFAQEREVEVAKDIFYVITDEPCYSLSNPDNLPLKFAYAYKKGKEDKIEGCALDDGSVTEFQLINEATKTLITNRIPSAHIKAKNAI